MSDNKNFKYLPLAYVACDYKNWYAGDAIANTLELLDYDVYLQSRCRCQTFENTPAGNFGRLAEYSKRLHMIDVCDLNSFVFGEEDSKDLLFQFGYALAKSIDSPTSGDLSRLIQVTINKNSKYQFLKDFDIIQEKAIEYINIINQRNSCMDCIEVDVGEFFPESTNDKIKIENELDSLSWMIANYYLYKDIKKQAIVHATDMEYLKRASTREEYNPDIPTKYLNACYVMMGFLKGAIFRGSVKLKCLDISNWDPVDMLSTYCMQYKSEKDLIEGIVHIPNVDYKVEEDDIMLVNFKE